MTAYVKGARRYEAYRINEGEPNRLCIICDGQGEATDFISCVEIFDEGGAQPPNFHKAADEFFFVLKGKGRADCDGESREITPGSSLLVKAGTDHKITNTGVGRLYLLCIMVPDEDFSELIRSGVPAELDAQDLLVLEGA